MERIRKEIEADPYAALFGRRLEPFASNFGARFENGFTSLWRSLFGLDKPENDTKNNIGRAKEDSRGASGGDMRVTESERAQSQHPPESTGAAFEFDPVSGRMVPKRHEDDYVIEGQAAAHGSPKDLEPPSSKIAEAKPYDYSESDIVGSSNKRDSTIPESSAVPEDTSGFNITPQSPASEFASPKKTVDDIPLEEPQGAAHAEPFQFNQRPEHPMPPDNDSYGALSNDNIVQPSQILGAEKTVSEKPVTEHHKEKGLNRAGFLSRRENEHLTSATTDARDEGLDQLRAHDIRAAYEPRRLSIESELEAETPKNTGESSTGAVDVDSHNKYAENLNADSSAPPSEWSINAALNQLSEQAPYISLSHQDAPATRDTSNAEVYRIFAYDPSSPSVTEAETTSSLQTSGEHLNPAEVLTRLANPARFLPCLNQMHKEGYEIVSGGGDILVFRKVPETKSSTIDDTQIEDIPETLTKEHSGEAAVAQPADDDFYTGNLPYNQSSTEQSHSKSAPKSRVRKVLRRMLISGAATAGTCYAIGVVTEYFRTGGVDGWGIDGFTEFESERRHMER